MQFIEGRGSHMKLVHKKNRERIIDWFQRNPNSTKTECCKALDLSPVTLRKHLKELKG